MKTNSDTMWWVAFFVQICVFVFVGAFLHFAVTSLPIWKWSAPNDDAIKVLRETITPVGKMMTVEHETHSYIIMIHGQNGVALLHSPDCGCKATQSMSYPFNW